MKFSLDKAERLGLRKDIERGMLEMQAKSSRLATALYPLSKCTPNLLQVPPDDSPPSSQE